MDNGMITKIWGPCAWFFLHSITFNYPLNPTAEDKQNYLNFFYNLQYILPCKTCRINYVKNIQEEDTLLSIDTFNNRHTLKLWLYNMHHKINNLTGKESKYTFTDLNNQYEEYRASCSNTSGHVGCANPNSKKLKNKKCKIVITATK